MNNKFGRVKMFVDELEKIELVENEEANASGIFWRKRVLWYRKQLSV